MTTPIRFQIRNPCARRWEELEPRDEGRYCGDCARVVVDLSRLTRAQAEARVRRHDEGRLCLALGLDPRTGDPVFRDEAPPPRPVGRPMALAAMLATAGCARVSMEPAEPPVLAPLDEDADGGDADGADLPDGAGAAGDEAPPMLPLPADSVAPVEDPSATRAVPACEVDRPTETGRPTPEQLRRTAAKHRPGSPSNPLPLQMVVGEW